MTSVPTLPILYLCSSLIMLVLALLANLDFLKTPNTALLIKENAATLAIMVPVLTGLIAHNRVIQWTAGLTFLAMQIAFAIIFSSKLS